MGEVKKAILNGVKNSFVFMIRNEADMKAVASPSLHQMLESHLKVDKKTLEYPQRPRAFEMPRPGKHKQEQEKKKVWRRYKTQVSFLCRYVLASKERTIPLK
mmetsp:Transcript_18480/g.21280  ORF Transcript_18480/g.21280 Transcript_18480/m.21280 type:complete len:102 (+) Transcript_18480:67-372(+)